MATPEQILAVRMEVGDTEISLPILSDSEYEYFIDKNSGSIARSSIDAAKTLLFKLSIASSDEVVGILSLKTSKQAAAYMEALKLYIRDPSLNPLYQNATLWAGNISRTEISTNNNTLDNNIPSLAISNSECLDTTPDNPFLI